MKWSHRLALVAAPVVLTAGAMLLPASAAWASQCQDTAVITVQPTTTQVSTPMSPAVVVEVEQSGKVDKSFSGAVTLTYAVNPDGAPEPSGSTVSAVKGVATFSGLEFSSVGFGFELKATISHGSASPASSPFDVVSSVVQCAPGSSCQSPAVSSDGTSGSVVAAAAGTSDELTATGGGFPSLSCTSYGGVLSFSVQDRSKVITMTLGHSQVPSQKTGKNWNGNAQFGICFGSPVSFTTASGAAATFNSGNDEYEGLLPGCSENGSSPCIAKQSKDCSGNVTTVIDAPAGDPRMTY